MKLQFETNVLRPSDTGGRGFGWQLYCRGGPWRFQGVVKYAARIAL